MFSVKAFAESILKMKDVGIRNCFEKAIIQLILKGMDVKEICQSNVLYPQIWTKQIVYIPTDKTRTMPYNGTFEDLAFDTPFRLFELDQFVHDITE